MPAHVAIRRLELQGLAPRDCPAPAEVGRRLHDAAQAFLPEALAQAVGSWSGESVLRIRRLEVDVTLDAAFEPRAFAAALAKPIAQELRRASERGSSDGVFSYESRALYLAALLEALAEGRAFERWWLRDAEGLRFLSPAQAIRTAITADARTGLEALAGLPPLRRMAILRALTLVEAERILREFALEGGGASLKECAEAVRRAANNLAGCNSALAAYIEIFSRTPALAGEALATAARLWAELEASARNGPERAAAAAAAQRTSPSESALLYRFTPFGGLLLLLPDLPIADIAIATSAWPAAPADAAALIAYTALGLCAGRDRFAEYLGDGLWRELFGLDPRTPASTVADRLCAFDDDAWAALTRLAAPLDRTRDARFLLAPRRLVAQRRARRVLAGLALAVTKRFARRLPGFRDASAAFLWANALATSAAVERHPNGWSVRLSRAPLDVLLSLARVAEGSIQAPSGLTIAVSRTPA
jgi:hypothetical protein